MFILEIAGKAVAITNADQDQAHELFMSEDFKDDLKSFSSEGKPLWDGSSLPDDPPRHGRRDRGIRRGDGRR